MIRKFYALIFLAFAISNLIAGNIDLSTARKVTDGFIKTSLTANVNLKMVASDFTISENGKPVYYIVGLSPKGFVIVAANDAATPVLGYSTENDYSPDNQPENFSLWMDGYAEMISHLNEQNSMPSKDIEQLWKNYLSPSSIKNPTSSTTVGPLLFSIWNQGAPYNYLCPADPTGPGGHVYAGCVATAMSQILYYWRYPQHGTGSHGYTWNPYGYLYADFGSTTYKWEEMVNSINSQNFEMAQLQLQLGISADMMYSGSGSGAYSEDAAAALRNNFGYDQSLEIVYRNNYTYEAWKTLLRSQIDLSQPMYYHGYGSGGHAFNVDGYQDTMYFHFNWGWGGSYNGFYHLNNLNPGGSNFNNDQAAIINFFPGENSAAPCGQTDTLTMLAGTFEDGSGPVAPYFSNSSCNWLIMPNDTLENIKLTFQRFDLEADKDFIYIYDGVDTDAPLLGRFTGNALPGETVATSGKIYIQFITDGDGVSNGFLASFTAKQASFCSGTTTLTAPSGSFNDGSGTYDYNDISMCRYEIEPENARSISLTFTEFSTAGEGDFIAIYNNLTHELYTKLYGQTNPGTLNFNTGKLMLIFKTDQYNTAPGWNINYTSSELTGISDPINAIKFSVYPNPAQNQISLNLNSKGEECVIQLISTNGTVVFQEVLGSTVATYVDKIDVSNIPRGLYILKVSSGNGTNFKRVVLN
ncbi:MAG: C10 family peptidase [Bacteroidales bacterium]